jgi:hypothetical protein
MENEPVNNYRSFEEFLVKNTEIPNIMEIYTVLNNLTVKAFSDPDDNFSSAELIQKLIKENFTFREYKTQYPDWDIENILRNIIDRGASWAIMKNLVQDYGYPTVDWLYLHQRWQIYCNYCLQKKTFWDLKIKHTLPEHLLKIREDYATGSVFDESCV